MKRWLILIYGAALLSCSKEEQTPGKLPPIESGEMMLVCAEGNFRWSNAEAGLVNLRTGEAAWKAFSSRNDRPLGDVLQSAAFWGGKLWLVVNNSGRLEAIDPASFVLLESITGLNSPRFLQAVSDDKAYCSDLYADKLWILRRGNNNPTGSIAMPGWTEEMLFSGNRLWVLCRKKPWVLGINPQTDQVTDTLFLPGNGSSMTSGSHGKIWISYESAAGLAPGVGLFHPDSAAVLQYWDGNAADPAPDRLQATVSGDTLFFLARGLCRIQSGMEGIHRYVLPSGNWYGLGLEASRRQLFVSDVKDYQQGSRILRLNYAGTTLGEFTGGIISSRFYFW